MKKQYWLITAAVVVIVAFVAGLMLLNGGDDEENAGQEANMQEQAQTEAAVVPQSGELAMDISDFKFQQNQLVVKKGTIVTWTNQDDVGHDVSSDSDSDKRGLNSPLLAKGEAYSFTFEEVGTYTYHCRPHPYMTGSVQVVE